MGAGILLERVAQRHVLDLPAPADLPGVGGDEGEGTLRIPLVLGQVQADPACHVPDRMTGLEVALDAVGVLDGAFGQRHPDLGPEPDEHRDREILGPAHRRDGLGEVFESGEIGFGKHHCRRLGRVERATGCADELPPQFAPEGEARIEVGGQFGGAEVQQAVATTPAESLGDLLVRCGGWTGAGRRAVAVNGDPSAW